MWTLFIKSHHKLWLTSLVILLCGCASTPTQQQPVEQAESAEQTDVSELFESLETTEPTVSRYADIKEMEIAAASDTEYTPPIPPATNTSVQSAEQASANFFLGLQALMIEDRDTALAIFSDMGKQFSDLSGPLVNQGLIHYHQGDLEKAEDVLQKALSINASNPYIHNTLGVILRNRGEFSEARRHYEQAITLAPTYAQAHFNLAILAELYLQDLVLALDHYRVYQTLQRHPDTTVENWILDLERRVQ